LAAATKRGQSSEDGHACQVNPSGTLDPVIHRKLRGNLDAAGRADETGALYTSAQLELAARRICPLLESVTASPLSPVCRLCIIGPFSRYSARPARQSGVLWRFTPLRSRSTVGAASNSARGLRCDMPSVAKTPCSTRRCKVRPESPSSGWSLLL
jgi:hypothetical protein